MFYDKSLVITQLTSTTHANCSIEIILLLYGSQVVFIINRQKTWYTWTENDYIDILKLVKESVFELVVPKVEPDDWAIDDVASRVGIGEHVPLDMPTEDYFH